MITRLEAEAMDELCRRFHKAEVRLVEDGPEREAALESARAQIDRVLCLLRWTGQ